MSELALQRIQENKEKYIKGEDASYLDLGNCNIKYLPEEIGDCIWLEKLILSNTWVDIWTLEECSSCNEGEANFILSIPNSMSNLINLKFLYISGELFNQFPIQNFSPIENLYQLEVLNISSTRLDSLTSIKSILGLLSLDISNTLINNISLLNDLIFLQRFNCSFNTNINDLSPIKKLTNIDFLSCSFTSIYDLTPIVNLTKLEILFCSDTLIEDLSPIDYLSEIVAIDVSNTNIEDLSIVNWSKKKYLSEIVLYNTKIYSLKPLFNFLSTHEIGWELWEGKIRIGNCPLTDPPLEIAKQGNEAILRYWEEQDRLAALGIEEVVPLMEAKVLLVGQGESGKTSLRKKLVDMHSEMPAPDKTTIGIEITPLVLPTTTGRDLTLHLWDFGGQNIQQFAHQFFLTDEAVYVLLSNDREQNPNFQYWLSIIELLGKNSKVLIVQNEKNGHCEELKTAASIRARFANVVAPFHQFDISKSAGAHNDRYEALKRAIVEQALALPITQEKRVASMVAIRKRLEALAQHGFESSVGLQNPPNLAHTQPPILSWDEYWAVCQGDSTKGELGIESEALANDWLAVFAKIGVCLHYPDDIYLRNKIFLHPQWIIDALFMLLYAEKIVKKNGHFTEEDVQDIWTQPHYKNMHRDLLRLIERFELAYSIPNTTPQAWILPQRLPAAQDFNWQPAQKTVIVYQYAFMPRGIITRIICRLHRKIKNDAVWNDALVVAYQGEEAFIREVYGENRIVIEATTTKNTELLNLVINQIDEIHADLRNSNLNLNVEKLVPCNCEKCLKSKEPHRFDYDLLFRLLAKPKEEVTCIKSLEDVSIWKLLQGTGLNYQQRFTPHTTTKVMKKVFISYSKEDAAYLKDLKSILKPIAREGKISAWDDTQLHPGEEWDSKIMAELETADIILMLVSRYMLATDYIYEKEMKKAIERAEKGEAVFVPIMIRDCDWNDSPFAKFNILPSKAKPVSDYADQEKAWTEISKRLKSLLDPATPSSSPTSSSLKRNDQGLGLTPDQAAGAPKDTSGLGLSSDDLRNQLEAKLAAQPGNHLLIMLSGRLNDVERQMALGILDGADYQRERNRIRAALLQA